MIEQIFGIIGDRVDICISTFVAYIIMNIAVLTGDVVNSRKVGAFVWMPELKSELAKYGQEPKDWEVYRGDSFQLKTGPSEALIAAIGIKASMKQYAGLNARIAIGIGSSEYLMDKITESNGEAFILSGETFDSMKKQTLALSTNNEKIDEVFNLILDFASYAIDSWSASTVKVIITALNNPDKNQSEIAKLIGVSQGSVSETYKRAGYNKILNTLALYEKTISELNA